MMDQEKIEELKKLAKPIQDFMASNSDLKMIQINVQGNKVTIKYSGTFEINTHYHNLDSNAGEYSFNSKHEL